MKRRFCKKCGEIFSFDDGKFKKVCDDCKKKIMEEKHKKAREKWKKIKKKKQESLKD